MTDEPMEALGQAREIAADFMRSWSKGVAAYGYLAGAYDQTGAMQNLLEALSQRSLDRQPLTSEERINLATVYAYEGGHEAGRREALEEDLANADQLEAIRMAYKTGYNEGYSDSSDGLVDHDACEEGWGQYQEALAASTSELSS